MEQIPLRAFTGMMSELVEITRNYDKIHHRNKKKDDAVVVFFSFLYKRDLAEDIVHSLLYRILAMVLLGTFSFVSMLMRCSVTDNILFWKNM